MSKRLYSFMMVTMFLLATFITGYAFADSSVIAPADFLSQVLDAIKGFGGLSTMLKISAVIALLVSSMKVSFLHDLIWIKLGAAQAWVAPLLGLIAGVMNLGSAGPITVASVMAYVSAGAGAIILYELLDSIKSLPGLGPAYVGAISFIEGMLGKKSV